MRAEVIAIGDELTTGQRLDTNSQWLARELGVIGIPVAFHTTVTDSLEDGVAAFRIAASRADVILATGGLGPTADDLTRDVLSLTVDLPLELSDAALAAVEARFAARVMPMAQTNRRQAMFPKDSRMIPNPDGTAPGIDIDIARVGGGTCRAFALPGVSSEMRVMWEQTVKQALLAMQPDASTLVFRRIKCFGAGESAVEAMLPDLIRRGRDPLVGITVHEGTITLRIAAHGRTVTECLAKIAPTEAIIRTHLGQLVYGVEDEELQDAALAAIDAAGATLATIEVATHGQIASLFAASAARMALEPSNAQSTLRTDTLVGSIVVPDGNAPLSVDELVEQCRRVFKATHILAVGSVVSEREQGTGSETVELVLAGPEGALRLCHRLGGGGSLRRSRAAQTAIDVVRKAMEAKTVPTRGRHTNDPSF